MAISENDLNVKAIMEALTETEINECLDKAADQIPGIREIAANFEDELRASGVRNIGPNTTLAILFAVAKYLGIPES